MIVDTPFICLLDYKEGLQYYGSVIVNGQQPEPPFKPQMLNEFLRSRITYLMILILVVILGLSSRRYARLLPSFLADYAGDTLWALAAFIGIGLLFPSWTTLRLCVTALLFAFSIEVSQLYHAAWIDQIRNTKIGGLILGYGFLWSDLLCYGVGIGIGCILEILLLAWIRSHEDAESQT